MTCVVYLEWINCLSQIVLYNKLCYSRTIIPLNILFCVLLTDKWAEAEDRGTECAVWSFKWKTGNLLCFKLHLKSLVSVWYYILPHMIELLRDFEQILRHFLCLFWTGGRWDCFNFGAGSDDVEGQVCSIWGGAGGVQTTNRTATECGTSKSLFLVVAILPDLSQVWWTRR